MSESPYARLARLHDELSQVYRELDRTPAPQQSAPQPATPRCALRVRDVAERLGVSERTVRDLRAAGKLPPTIDLPNVVRWQPEVIERWLAEQQ